MKNLNKIEEIYHAVLELEVSERTEFLHQKCGDDKDLRREVESLLSFEEKADSFIESPPEDLAEDFFANRSSQNLIGKKLNNYKVISLLGAGGMGEVYLAEDIKLGRKIAIKLLPAKFSANTERKARFLREARSVSALNHPNIITVYGIEETEKFEFIATEFIDGETLSESISKRAFEWKEVVKIALQLSDALESAHKIGIIHRDIKPANIMIREDGYVKILDFGLAKMLVEEKDATSFNTEEQTAKKSVLGTINYMSPEQALGEELDARTDIFSLGVVLYEMISGELPFEGKTSLETVGSVLYKKPKPLENSEVPTQIKDIINKCLQKDRNDRYQSAKDVLTEFENAKRDLSFSDSSPLIEMKNRFRPFTATSPKLFVPLVIILIFAVGFTAYQYLLPEQQIESIAVLPFVNESGDPNAEYLSDGMTESLIRSLSNVPDISVKARSTVYHYKGKNVSPKKVGEELNVQAVLLGRVVQRGQNLQLNLELVNTETQDILWTEQYIRQENDLVLLQSTIAFDILKQLKNKLSNENKKQLTSNYPENSETYKLYLQGRYYWNQRTESGDRQAVDYFQKAIDQDPNFALAYVGLADSIAFLGSDDFDSYKLAKPIAQKAIAIDESLGEAHTTLAMILQNSDLNWTEAEREYQKAIEKSPNYATAHHWYGEMLMQMGKTSKALKHYKKAAEIDPFSMPISSDLGITYYYAGQTERAVEHLRNAIEKEPNFYRFYSYLARIYEYLGEYDKAIDANYRGYMLLKNDEATIEKYASELKRALEVSGKNGYWQKRLEIHQTYSKLDVEWQGDLINIYLQLGDKTKALDELEKSIKAKDFDLFFLKVIPEFEEIRDEPRFIKLVEEIGFPQ